MSSLASIRRRITQAKHRRSGSNESSTSDDSASSSVESGSTVSLSTSSSSRRMSYIPHSHKSRPKTMISAPILLPGQIPGDTVRTSSPPMPTRSMTVSGGAPPRPPRFTRSRAAPLPPPAAAAASALASRPISHAPPARPMRASISPSPPPVPRRAMPPWRASLIGLAESYAPLGGNPGMGGYNSSGHTHLMSCLQDPALSERQALAALRSYVDRVHALHSHHSLSNYPSDVSETDSDYGVAV